MAFAFEKLVVYQKSVVFADLIYAYCLGFGNNYALLTRPLSRAAFAIAATIAEGDCRSTRHERKNFFLIARATALECAPLLEVALRRKLLTPTDHETLKSQLEEITCMLSVMINELDHRDE